MSLPPNWLFFVRAHAATSLVTFLFGLDTGSIGPVTSMTSFESTFGPLSATIHGVVVSSLLIPGAVTALVAGVLAHHFGHVKLITLGSLIYAVGSGIECGSTVLSIFIFGRLVKGIGNGLFLSNIFVQVSETAPSRIRGIMTAIPLFVNSLGLVAGFFICYGVARLDNTPEIWRIPPGISAGLGLCLSVTYWIIPPSPRWLMSKGRIEEALKIAEKLGFDEEERADLSAQVDCDPTCTEPVSRLTFEDEFRKTWADFKLAFSAPFRGRTIFGCFLMAMQQFSGIDGVLYYAPTLFAQAGLRGERATFLASGASALAIFAASILGAIFADHWGRKTSSIVGGIIMSTVMIVIGSLYAADKVSGAGKWIVMASIYIFAFIFNLTWAICLRAFLVESMPRKIRSSASGLAQSCNWIANYLVALVTPVLISNTLFGAYFLFAACSLVCTIVVVFYMVETRGHSLEAIERRYMQDKSDSKVSSTAWTRMKQLYKRTDSGCAEV